MCCLFLCVPVARSSHVYIWIAVKTWHSTTSYFTQDAVESTSKQKNLLTALAWILSQYPFRVKKDMVKIFKPMVLEKCKRIRLFFVMSTRCMFSRISLVLLCGGHLTLVPCTDETSYRCKALVFLTDFVMPRFVQKLQGMSKEEIISVFAWPMNLMQT